MCKHYITSLKSLLISYKYMKLMKFVPVFLVLVFSVTAVMATHTPNVYLQPSEMTAGTVNDVSLNVMNSVGDSIVMVELSVPERDMVPLYVIKEIVTPEGWTFKTTARVGQTPYKVTWYTNGDGIKADNSLAFGLKVQTPNEKAEHVWQWTTTDNKGSSQKGVLKSTTGTAPVSYLKVSAPTTAKAGSPIKVTVTAYDSSDRVKSDYTGTISLMSSDSQAVMPEKYTFVASDNGHKTFTVKLKTAGKQTVSVSDGKTTSSKSIEVSAGSFEVLEISSSDLSINVGDTIVLNAMASDVYSNKVDVTAKTIWDIDNEAKGSWIGNTYKAGKVGVWTITGTYMTLANGVKLVVGGEAEQVEVPVEIPIEEGVAPEEEAPEEVTETQTAELTIVGDASIAIPPGSNDTMVLTVSNEGNVGLTGVELSFEGVPSDWLLTFPLSSDIDAGESKDYLVIIYVPENETGTKEITFAANSKEGATAEKMVSLTLGTAPTGLFEAIPKNILQLGVVIIAVAAVIIIGWELWFKK